MSEDLSRDVLLQEDLQPTAQLQKVKKTSRQSINPKSIVLENAPVQQHEAVRTNARPHSQDKRTKLRSDLKESHFTHALTNQSSGFVPPSVVETPLPVWKQKMLLRLRRSSTLCLLASRRRVSVTAGARLRRSSNSRRSSVGVQLVERPKYTPEQLQERFRYAVCMVCFAVRLNLALREYSWNTCKEGSTLEELNHFSKDREFSAQTEKLVFSPASFAATNVGCPVRVPPDEVMDVLRNARRTASLISREDVECLVVDAETCRRIFPEAIEREDTARLHCLRKISIFSDWPETSLQKLSTSCKLIECPYGSIIDRNTAESDFVYMVTKDLVSLLKSTCPLPLILVSRGSEVISIPKPLLQTTPPLHCWKSLLDRARKTPRFPSTSVLSHLFLEHAHWSAYKTLVLRDSLDRRTDGYPIAMMSAKTILTRSPSPLARSPTPTSIQRPSHTGPCLRSWNHPSPAERTPPSQRTRRAVSIPCS